MTDHIDSILCRYNNNNYYFIIIIIIIYQAVFIIHKGHLSNIQIEVIKENTFKPQPLK